jgi:hypothetical protein
MNKAKRKTIVIVSFILLGLATVFLIIYQSLKKKNNQTTATSAVSGAVTAGYTKESFPLRKGMYGDNVMAMQYAFIHMGISCGKYGSDGKFGADTLTAVRTYFKDNSKNTVTQEEWMPLYSIYKINTNLPGA